MKTLLVALLCLFPIIASASVVPYATAESNLSPDFTWRLGDTLGASSAADSSGHSRPGTISGVTFGTAGLLKGDSNTAASLAGGTITSPAFITTSTGWSVSFIFEFTSTPVSDINLVNMGDVDSGNGVRIKYQPSSSTMRVFWATGSGVPSVEITINPLTGGRVCHVVISFDITNSLIHINIDGTRTSTSISGTVLNPSGLALTIGGFTGVLDEVMFKANAVWTSESQDLFRSARGIDSTVNAYIVSTTGNYFGSGTISDPLDFPSMQNWGLAGADTQILLRGGTYNKSNMSTIQFIWTFSGTPGHPIVIEPYPGEFPVLDYVDTTCMPDGSCGGNGNNVWGSYIRFQGLEMLNSNSTIRGGATTRTTAIAGSDPTDTERGDELAFFVRPGAVAIEIVNNYIHDMGMGIYLEDGNEGCTIYGNIFQNNGWFGAPGDTNHGPDVYAHNRLAPLLVKHNLFMWGIKQLATQIRAVETSTVIQHVTVQENISYQCTIAKLNSLGDDITFTGNQIFQNILKFGESDQSEQGTGSATNNYIYGGTGDGAPLELNYWDNLTATGNTVIGGASAQWAAVVLRQKSSPTQTATINNNTYYAGANNTLPFVTTVDTTETDRLFSGWQGLGYDGSGTYNSTSPPVVPTANVTRIYPNAYQTGRGTFVVWNWHGDSTVTINLSTLGLSEGQSYTVRNPFNWNGGDYDSGTYHVASPTKTLTIRANTARALLIGQTASTPLIDTRFQVFEVMPGPVSASAPGNPTGLTATFVSSTQINLSWTNADSLDTGIIIEQSLDGLTWTSVTTTAAHATSFSATGLTPRTNAYMFRVRATNGSGDSLNAVSGSVVTTKICKWLTGCN